MVGTITRSNHPSALWPGVLAWFGQKYNEHPMECSMIFETNKSNKSYEELVETTGFGLAPIKPEGAAIQYDSDQEGYKNRFDHDVYALGYIVTREEMEDNQYQGKSKRRAGALAFGMRQTKEIVHANVFNRAFDPAYSYGDGASLCSTSHATLDGTQSNTLAIAADLSEASLEQMLIDIKKSKDSRGLKISIKGDKIIVPDELTFTAERILKSNLRVGTDLNDVNAIKSMGMLRGGKMVYTYLTDPDAWFIQTNVQEGLQTLKRRGIEFRRDNDFDTENAKAKCSERYTPGVGDWRCLWGSPGA